MHARAGGSTPFIGNQRGGGRTWGTLRRPGERDLAQGALDSDGDGVVAATEASGLRGRSGRSPARGKVGGEELGHDAWKATASRRWPAALLSGGGAALRRRHRKTERERGGRRQQDYFAISEKFRDPTVKQK